MTRSSLRTLTTTIALTAIMVTLAACNKATDTPPGEPGAQPGAAAAVADASPSVAACNRECLIEATDAYVAAIVAHEPATAPLAEDAVFVENVTRMQPGEGLWQSVVKGPGAFEIHVPDEINQAVGYLAMMTYMAPPPPPQGLSPEQRAEFAASNAPIEQPVIVAFRLQFDDSGQIVEAEHLLSGIREDFMPKLQVLRPGILTEIPVAQRLPHDKLIEIGAAYYDALDDNNGELAPFSPDCERHENGMITASGTASQAPAIPGTTPTPAVARDCRNQLNTNSFQYIDRIENRRVFAADPQTGLVIGLSHFRHPMDNLPYTVTNLDGTTSERNKDNMAFAPFDLPAAHIFKVGPDGQIHEIEAMGFTTVYNSPTGWE